MIVAVLQARVSSSRLPGKVLKPLAGEPMLWRQIERVKRSRRLDGLVVATSEEASDDAIAELCAARGVDCHRGSLNDVLDRFYRAAARYRPAHVVRLTGDCPLTDPAVIDALVARHLAGGFAYTSNALQRTYPDGLDVEIMTFESLEAAWAEARLPSEREHVTPFLYKHPERFALGHLTQPRDLSAWRWTVDEPSDYALIARIYEALHPADPAFGMEAVLAFLASHPELAAANAGIACNEGYQRSLAAEAEGA